MAADEAARSGRLSLAELLDHLQHALVVLDGCGHVVGYNRSALTLLELPEDLMARAPLIDEVVRWQVERGDLKGQPERLIERVWHHLRATQASGEPHVYSYTTASGRTLQGSTIALPGGGWVRIYTDVTRHAQTLAALRESEARLRSLTELSADWFWEWDEEGRYTRMEGRVVREHDIAPLFLGRRPWEVAALNRPRPEDWNALLQAVRRREPFQHFEVQRILPNGRSHWFALSGEPVYDAQGVFRGYRGIGRDITARKEAEATIQRLAFYDGLTGLCNRRAFQDRLLQAQASSARSGRWAALCFIDLDDFKDINDAFGHAAGDALLREMAQRLREAVRADDTVGRLGGDEFVVLLEDLHADEEQAAWRAQQVAEKLRQALERPAVIGGHDLQATPSIGITLFRGQADKIEEILGRADLAMYHSKAAGRNAVRFFDPAMQARVVQRATLQRELRHGLRDGELALFGQPIVDAQAQTCGQEALLRWRHPVRGMVPPAEFIPVAEQTGLILPIGQWVLREACRVLARWAADPARAGWTLAVNLSARQLRQPDFVASVQAALADAGADPRRLKLELTESLLLHDVEDTIAKMEALASLGIQFALDDFGTGYSSLAYLKRLPLTQLKIDRSFVRDLLSDPNDAAIARTILQLAQSLEMEVVAEGVETVGQYEVLRAMGCRLFQGYHFGRPAPLEPADPPAAAPAQPAG
ncbi:putative bifunctional diguanylate cyclase/phosphodiesterase [Tepidimonas alkaliphilus]|uniref:putative bifunctional diguanylate cyclase/phosphodiesterase n=1 Tax=Tepidimonas alkaliphilus TaxID=2588942 RepID=UPI00163D4EFE|nr:EAL domain-containing protein [Tepidimonas alkaliphilus]